MNTILTALNPVALVALVTFHFHGTATPVEQVNVEIQSGLQKPAQLAVMTDKRANPAMLTNETQQQMPRATGSATQRWVF